MSQNLLSLIQYNLFRYKLLSFAVIWLNVLLAYAARAVGRLDEHTCNSLHVK